MTTPMNSLNRDQWKEVDERFDKEFTCVVTYEKWPDEEEQRLREPQYKFKDFPNTNPKIIKNFLHSELEKVRQETIEATKTDFKERVELWMSTHSKLDKTFSTDDFIKYITQDEN